MLEKVSTILKMADESNTAVISFICTDYNMVYSVVTTAEKNKHSCIGNASSGTL